MLRPVVLISYGCGDADAPARLFRQLFAERGDPWGYENAPHIRDHEAKCLAFLGRRFAPDFSGTIIELGAFHGHFTKRLVEAYPRAEIVVNDIAEIALSVAREKVAADERIRFITADMREIRAPVANRPTVILLFECLYYLKGKDRDEAIRHLAGEFRPSMFFVSGPVSAVQYFDDRELLAIMRRNKYRCIEALAINMRPETANSSLRPDWIEWLCRHSSRARSRFAHQVVYCFSQSRAHTLVRGP